MSRKWNNPWVILTIATLLLASATAYWVVVRPSQIKSQCSTLADNTYRSQVDGLSQKHDDDILAATGVSWHDIFTCREMISDHLLEHSTELDSCRDLIYGPQRTYFSPVDVADRIDLQTQGDLRDLAKRESAVKDDAYKTDVPDMMRRAKNDGG
jgi:hypothetical protein